MVRFLKYFNSLSMGCGRQRSLHDDSTVFAEQLEGWSCHVRRSLLAGLAGWRGGGGQLGERIRSHGWASNIKDARIYRSQQFRREV